MGLLSLVFDWSMINSSKGQAGLKRSLRDIRLKAVPEKGVEIGLEMENVSFLAAWFLRLV